MGDYCYNPLHGGVKELGGPNDSKAKNLQRCVGECDADAQCAYGLKCFQRSKGEKIPGCKDGKKKMPGHYDYCYDPKTEVKKPKTTPKKPVCTCPKNFAPVCGKNGKTYGNACMAKCAKTAVAYKGKCKTAKTTPKKPVCKCPRNMAPVCGKNGKTYGNARMAKCAKTAVAYKGKCKTATKTTPKKPKRDCSKNNGGCHKARSCLKGFGVSFCGSCKNGLVNDGLSGCKKAPTKKPTKKKTTKKKKPTKKPTKTTPKKPKRDCSKNNGGCHKARSCLKGFGVSFCGSCKNGLVNDGLSGVV